MNIKRLLSPENLGSKHSYIDRVFLELGEDLGLQSHPEERLFYFLDGRGIISIYEEFPRGDVYETRQDTAVYITPRIKHQIINVGDTPLRYLVWRQHPRGRAVLCQPHLPSTKFGTCSGAPSPRHHRSHDPQPYRSITRHRTAKSSGKPAIALPNRRWTVMDR